VKSKDQTDIRSTAKQTFGDGYEQIQGNTKKYNNT
jgi:hypothetical protein